MQHRDVAQTKRMIITVIRFQKKVFEPIMRFLSGALLAAALLLPVLSCSPGRHDRMEQELAALQAMNQADSVLTNDSLAQALADYFDDNGTPNEQMEAHYLLGRTHADRGEAPAALAAYHDAIDRADTTATDCDYRLLSKVYGQMGSLLYWQQLPESATQAYGMAYRYAMMQKDTLLAIVAYEQRGNCYCEMEQFDSAASVINIVHELYLKHGDTLSANTAIGPMVYIATQRGMTDDARRYIYIYGRQSRTASDTLRYSESWGQFLLHQGIYHIGIQSVDSAIVYLMRGLSLVENVNNKQLAYDGLYSAYKMIGDKDSIVKYAQLLTETSEDVIDLRMAENIQHMQSLYNYDRISRKAATAEQEATEERKKAAVMALTATLMLLALVTIGAALVIPKLMSKVREHAKQVRFVMDKMLYGQISNIESQKGETSSGERAEKAEYLRASLMSQEEILEDEARFLSFQQSNIVQDIKGYGSGAKPLLDSHWARLTTAVDIYAPGYMARLEEMHPAISLVEKRICMLALIEDMSQKSKAVVIGQEYHAMAMRRKRLYSLLFGTEGSAKDLEKDLRKIAFGG